MKVTKDGYLARKTAGFGSPRQGRERRPREVKRNFRDWWIVKHGSNNAGIIALGDNKISLPPELIGKKVRFKLEEVHDDVELEAE